MDGVSVCWVQHANSATGVIAAAATRAVSCSSFFCTFDAFLIYFRCRLCPQGGVECMYTFVCDLHVRSCLGRS